MNTMRALLAIAVLITARPIAAAPAGYLSWIRE